MADVFISYAEEDGQTAKELAVGLEAAGFAVWYYERDSIPGPPYLSQVGQAIALARAVVLLISRDSLGSNQVTNEIVLAHESGKHFVPVLVGISHVEFQQRQPQWRLALGAATSVRVPPQGVGALLGRLVSGLRELGVEAHGAPSWTEKPPRPDPEPTAKPAPQPLPPEAAPPPAPPEQAPKAAPPPLGAKAAPPRPAGTPELITNSIGMKLKLIPAGRFRMGSDKGKDDEEPVHDVTLSTPFYLGVYPVTQAQYKRVAKKNPSNFNFQGANRPVECVSWNDAVEFCRNISKMEGREYRLPTEAEWEYACRAGSTTEYCFGDDETRLGEYAWYEANSGRQTQDVGQKKPNDWGLHDMHGNVWEWTASPYADPFDGSEMKGEGAPAGFRVCRGGGWYLIPRDLRSARRYRVDRSQGDMGHGFRVAAGPRE